MRIAAALLILIAGTGAVPRVRDLAAPVQTVRTWYENGQLKSQREYRRGRETGLHRGWWSDGVRAFEYNYKNGLLEGTSREYLPSGDLYREQHYSAGHEAGLQRLYWADGRVRASYEVRDGRRYGLMGAKGCVTRGDSLARGLL